MFTKRANKSQTRIDTLIGAGTRIEGDITFTGGLRVDGEIKGNVSATGDQQGTLVISEQARIDGDINVAHLVINGAVNGAVCSSEMVELQALARVTGDVQYSTIEIHLGAVIQGRLVHQKADDKPVD